ncbi:uncharacterized protein PFL1_00559 [Pseudozyma flocculosa PF-1]|uniref:Uncharacterized protein n=1 Tax=Pseudozyma flocculosa TaxID=84751 RepID=A0A5C3ES33_9BASI|nr:uncharacterized protein PFL1_00559 [Pseudozyma flocculosa PF-1]EPQ32363.1 hypothetical protein PFL1_00559 [Pseudozyma flocculosa PF-1]SPO34670.1 uncharacterized protein PSFLO_00141 [Pseudozyma flocculosa]
MFSQWRGKRHYPFNDADTAASAIGDANAVGRSSSRLANPKHALRINAAMSGLRTKAIVRPASRGRGPRDGSTSSQSDYDFAAGPRSGSRGAKSLEFGSGVVPEPRSGDDDTYADFRSAPVSLDAGPSAPPLLEPPSPRTVIASGPSSPRRPPLQTSKSYSGPLTSSSSPQLSLAEDDTFSLGDFDDFRAILALATSPLSDDISSSPSGWTEASNLTTPETGSSWSPRGKLTGNPAAQPHRAVAHAQSNLVSSLANSAGSGVGGHRKKLSLADAMAIFGQMSPATSSDGDAGAASGPLPSRVRELSHGRADSVLSFPETVSGPSSTDTEWREFNRRPTNSETSLHGAGSAGPSNGAPLHGARLIDPQERHGLGIFGSGEESHFEGSEASSRSSRIKTSSMSGSSFTASSHRKSESYHSTQSSTDSWARSSRPVEIDRQSIDSADDRDSAPNRRTAGRMVFSDSDHSVSTAETSTDPHDLGPLSTIAEKVEEHQPEPRQSASGVCGRAGVEVPSTLIEAHAMPDGQSARPMDAASSSMPPQSPSSASGTRASPAVSRKTSFGVLALATPTFGSAPEQRGRSKGHQASASASGASVSNGTESSSTPTASAFGPGTPTKHARNTSGPDSRRRPSAPSLLETAPISAKSYPGPESSSLTAPMPSAPFPGSFLSTPDAIGGSGFASLPASPLTDGGPGQTKQGIRRKARPAALTLSKSATNLSAPFSASALSPGGALRGAPSPTRSRAPPPSAPPPDEPLPPLPPTPSLICPKSPLILSRKSSAANLARAASEAPPTPTLPRSTPRTPALSSFSSQAPSAASPLPKDKPFSFPTVAPDHVSSKRGDDTLPSHSLVRKAEAPKQGAYGDVGLDSRRPSLLDAQVCGVGYSSSTEELDDSSAFPGPRRLDGAGVARGVPDAAPSPTASTVDRGSMISVDSGEGTCDDDAQLAVATTLTRVPSTAVRMTVYRGNARVRTPSAAAAAAPEMVTSALPVERAQSVGGPASPLRPATAPAQAPAPAETSKPASATASAVSAVPISTVQRMAAQFEGKAVKQGPGEPMRVVAPAPAPFNGRQQTAPPSAWTRRFAEPSSHAATASIDSSVAGEHGGGMRAATEGGHERLTESALEMRSGLPRRASFSSMRARRLEMLKDKADFAAAVNDEAKARILKRTEGRFTDAFGEVAFAFKQLLAEKRMLEQLVRDITPLDGLGENGQGLADYIVGLNERLDNNTAEIRKLLDLLDQQRIIIDKMLDTHRAEVGSYLDEIDSLQHHLETAIHDGEVHRSNAIRLHEELDRAHQELVSAKAEALKARNGLHDEGTKREKASAQLRSVREKLHTTEAELASRTHALNALRSERAKDNEALEAEVGLLRETLAKAGIRPPQMRNASPGPHTRRNTSPDPGKHGEISVEGLAQREQAARARGSPGHVSCDDDADIEARGPSGSGRGSLDKVTDDAEGHAVGTLRAAEETELLAQLRRENAELKKSLVGKEAELVQARLGSADGAVGEWSDDASSSKPASETASDASSLTELKRLRAQLAEQRNRESQIRTAYKILREELRKTQTGFQSERRRNSGFSLTGHGGLPPSASSGITTFGSLHTDDDPSVAVAGSGEPSSPAEKRRSLSSVQLKRLSLPLNVDPFGPRSAMASAEPSPSTAASSYSGLNTPQSAGYRPSSVYGVSGLAGKRAGGTFRVGLPVFPSSPHDPLSQSKSLDF